VRAAALAAVTSFEPTDRCESSFTARLVARVYGSSRRCRQVVERDSPAPNFDATVVDDRITGQHAVVRVLVKNGDEDDLEGELKLRYERAGWRIDDFEADYLRSELGKDVAGAADVVEPVLTDQLDSCIVRGFRHVSDANLTRIAYGVIGARRAGLLAAYRRLAKCRPGGISVLRRIFERDFREQTHLSREQLDCVLRGLRIGVPATSVAAIMAASGTAGSLSRRLLAPRVRAAANACRSLRPA
jgi:hypothetical protein